MTSGNYLYENRLIENLNNQPWIPYSRRRFRSSSTCQALHPSRNGWGQASRTSSTYILTTSQPAVRPLDNHGVRMQGGRGSLRGCVPWGSTPHSRGETTAVVSFDQLVWFPGFKPRIFSWWYHFLLMNAAPHGISVYFSFSWGVQMVEAFLRLVHVYIYQVRHTHKGLESWSSCYGYVYPLINGPLFLFTIK